MLPFRQIAKSPAFTAAAVTVLALGIGANTAIFSVVEAALLRPLPFPHSEQLVRMYEAYDNDDSRANTLNLSEITAQQWRDHARDVISDLGLATGAAVTLGATPSAPAHTFSAARISANFFPVLGLIPALGRNFTAAEDRPNAARVVIVSDDFWRRELGGKPDALGRTVLLDNAPYTVIGVMPPRFRHPYRADVWLPLAAAFDPGGARGHYLYGVARLKPGLAPEQADAGMRRVCAEINAAAPDPANPRRAYARPLREGFVADLQPKLLVIAGAALCALLVAAANFAGLLLARSVGHEGETAVRAALGASRRRLVGETVAHALGLAAIGTVVGLLAASWLTPALVALSPEGSDATGSAMREFDYAVRLDWPVFAFATAALVLLGVGFGLIPAWRASRVDLRSALSGTARGATIDRGTRRMLSLLVVGEIAIAMVLLVASATLAQYFKTLLNEPWGFATEHRIGFNVMLSDRLFPAPVANAAKPAEDIRVRTIEQIVSGLRALPGVRSVTAMTPHPMNAARQLFSNNPEGTPPPEPRGYYLAYLSASLPGHLATLGHPLLRGRDFSETDRAGSPPVCIVNESYARRFWPGQDPIGKRVKWGRLDGPRPWATVIGVAADTKTIADPNDGEIVGLVTIPIPQLLALSRAFDEFTFEIETDPSLGISQASLEPAVRGALARVDSRLAAYELRPFDELAAESRVTERFAFVLISLFGILGLILSAIGLYGLLALQVARRTREFGVRSALGATASNLIRLVAGQGGALVLGGVLVGSAAAFITSRLVHTRWPELPAAGALAWAVSVAVLFLAATVACYLPARRASRVDPMTALRAE